MFYVCTFSVASSHPFAFAFQSILFGFLASFTLVTLLDLFNFFILHGLKCEYIPPSPFQPRRTDSIDQPQSLSSPSQYIHAGQIFFSIRDNTVAKFLSCEPNTLQYPLLTTQHHTVGDIGSLETTSALTSPSFHFAVPFLQSFLSQDLFPFTSSTTLAPSLEHPLLNTSQHHENE